MSLPKRIGIIVAVGLFVLAAAVVVVFAIGKPTTTPVSPEAAAPAEVASLETAGEAGSDPLAVEIPGCVCHSDDPQVVEAHATYRMSECFDCHQGGMPEMGQ
jgi:hypothetical protein